MFDEHNSMMMLGLLNTLYNNGTITKEERDDIIELGEIVKEREDKDDG
jgi:hypothetical protein